MYKHIIETMVTDMNIQFEDGIVKAVQDAGVIVDKEELVKALMYDRNQYEEGYRDGRRDSVRHGRWVDNKICSNCGCFVPTDSYYDFLDVKDNKFCFNCGAKMDLEDNDD